jgi:F0F1-type ATP synthase membrane subunit c/vacuolar-type H+-ATPase subunit K
MPVFARLSRRFYEVVGEDVTQELVDWLNAVEEERTRRADLRLQLESFRWRSEVVRADLGPKVSFARSPACVGPAIAHSRLGQDFAGARGELRRFRSSMMLGMFLYSVATLLGTAVLLLLLR